MTDPRFREPATIAAAAILRRLRDPRVGGDHQNPGKYGIYFCDEGEIVRSVGGFASVKDASDAVDLVIAETVLEAAYEERPHGRRAADA